MSAGLGAWREIATLCIRGCSVNNPARFFATKRQWGGGGGEPLERDTGRNTAESVRGQIRLARWNRWSFIGCVIMSRIL